jgi:hypothetical protein
VGGGRKIHIGISFLEKPKNYFHKKRDMSDDGYQDFDTGGGYEDEFDQDGGM